MTLTNLQSLPEPLVRAVQWSDRDREGCDYTVTELLRPARQVALEQIHRDEITEDASDRLWLLLGSAGHTVLERSAHGGIIEKRFIVGLNVDFKHYTVGGKVDYSKDGQLWDYKFCSVYAAKDEPKPDWIAQLNCYRYLAGRSHINLEPLQIVAIFRDWSKPKARREPDYPQSQVRVLDLPLWRDDTTEQFIIDRIRAHEAAKVSLPECSPEEMWEKPEKWALMRRGAKKAYKLFDTHAEAAEHERRLALNYEIEHRPAERTRCESYCRCAPFCDQWKQFQKGVDNGHPKAV